MFSWMELDREQEQYFLDGIIRIELTRVEWSNYRKQVLLNHTSDISKAVVQSVLKQAGLK